MHAILAVPRACAVVATALIVTGFHAPVRAQTAPDAGRLLREQPQPPAAVPTPLPKTAPAAPTTAKPHAGPSFVLKGIRFKGVNPAREAELQGQVKIYLNRTVNFSILELIASQLTGYYLQKGYVARVVMPAQDVKDGIVEMQVVESIRGNLNVEKKGERVDEGRVAAFVDHRLAKGDALNVFELDAAISILNDQPGVQARSALLKGKQEGETDVVVSVADKSLWSGAVGINNHGGRASGIIQAQGSLTLNNPTGNFDAATLLVNASEGVTYGSADYSLAVGGGGLRVGASVSSLDYRLVDSSFAALDLKGDADTYGVYAGYPLARTPTLAVSLTVGHDIKKLVDRSAAVETGNREVRTTSLGISGALLHRFRRLDAQTSFGMALISGDSDQRNAGALAADNVTRGVNGGFTKLAFSVVNQVDFNPQWSSIVALRGQLAAQNLDSTERMSLGGPTAIRGYPGGEGLGDEGWLLNLNLRRKLGDGVTATFFVDTGGTRLNRDTWANWNAANPNLKNSYTLTGAGAGLEWRMTRNSQFSVVIAGPVGSNPGRDANGRNADGKGNDARAWASFNAQF